MENQEVTEIDLVEVLIKIKRLFFKRQKIILFCLSAGIFFGIYLIKSNEFKYGPSYEKQFVIYSHNISKESIRDIIESLKLRITTNSFDPKSDQNSEAEKANLTAYSVLNDVKDIEIDKEHYNESKNESLKLTIKVSKKENMNKAINAVFTYINSNNNLKTDIETVKANKLKLLSVVNKKIKEFDSINSEYSKTLTSSKSLYTINFKPNELKDYVDVYNKKTELEQDLNEINANVFLKEDRFPILYDKNIKKNIIVIGFGLGGLVLGIIISFLLLLYGKIKDLA